MRPAMITISCLILSTVSVPRPAQAGALSELSGQWRSAETEAEAAKREAAVEEAAKAMPPFARRKARKQLGERTRPVPKLDIVVDGTRVRLTRDGKSVELELNGGPRVIERDGQRAKMTAAEQAGDLVLRTAGDGGTRVAKYRLVGPGEMRVLVSMSGGRLETPINLEQTYARAEP